MIQRGRSVDVARTGVVACMELYGVWWWLTATYRLHEVYVDVCVCARVFSLPFTISLPSTTLTSPSPSPSV